MTQFKLNIKNEKAMEIFGQTLAQHLKPTDVIYLKGTLGAGKTTLTRYILKSLGVTDTIKSPTYSLVETYCTDKAKIHHFDFYRVNDSFELELMGIRDYWDNQSISLIEWPELVESMLPKANLMIEITVIDQNIRQLTLTGNKKLFDMLSKNN